MDTQRSHLSQCVLTLFSILVLLSGCKPATLPLPTSIPANSSVTTSPKASEVASLELEGSLLTLAPGASHKLAVAAVMKDLSRQNMTGKLGINYVTNQPDLVTISPDGMIQVSAKARTGSSATLSITYQGQSKDCLIKIKYVLGDTVSVSSGKNIVTNTDDPVVVVNKNRSLPEKYVPVDLVEPNIPFTFTEKSEKRLMRSEAAQALEKLFAQAKKDNIHLFGVSAYRSYVYQKSVYNGNVKTQGDQEASKYSAQPGQSEHQTGLAIDVSSASAKYDLVEAFGSTVEGIWLAKHASESGFIIRYPKGKEALTGYAYEPWHIRFVGEDIAKEIAAKDMTLEQYFQDAIPVVK